MAKSSILMLDIERPLSNRDVAEAGISGLEG
jgi:hypothetical protein